MSSDKNPQAKIAELESLITKYRHAEDQLGGIVNDLNNLLAAMKGQAQLACSDLTGQEKDELVRIVLYATLKAEGIIHRLTLRQPTIQVESVKKGAASGGAIASILVVDDEESMRNLLSRILRSSGYDVTVASSGSEAVEYGRMQTFDVAVIDYQLGQMNGIEVFQELVKESPQTHAIIITGDPSLDQLSKIKEGPLPAALIKKPFDINQIRERISYILSMRTALGS